MCNAMLRLSSAEHMKYVNAVEARHATFTPFVVSVDGVLGREARMFVNHLGDSIADMWKKSHSEVMGWVRANILRATNLCLHGSRRKWRRVMDINDGTRLPVTRTKLSNMFCVFFILMLFLYVSNTV